ncbi:hypothetical protein EJB05_55511, partial [Eragrostis curvula]
MGWLIGSVGGPTNNSLFFRNAKVGDWANHLTEEMAQKFDNIIEEKLKGCRKVNASLLLSDAEHDGLAEEADSLSSTTPPREGWWRPLFLLRSTWLTPPVHKSATLVQAQFQPRADDIILATYPKSGTTWLKALAFTLVNRSQHAVTGDKHPLLVQHPQDLVPFLELPDRALHPVAELEALPSPRLLCTHLPYALLPSGTSSLGCRIVYLCRDPKDIRLDFIIEFDKAFELFVEGVSFYGPIWEHYLGYWKQHVRESDRVLFLKYDEMMADPTKHVKMLAEFLHVPFSGEEESANVPEEVVRLCSFQNLKDLHSAGKSDRGRGVANGQLFVF